MDSSRRGPGKRIAFYGRIPLALLLCSVLATGAFAHIRATGSNAATEAAARIAPVLRLPALVGGDAEMVEYGDETILFDNFTTLDGYVLAGCTTWRTAMVVITCGGNTQ